MPTSASILIDDRGRQRPVSLRALEADLGHLKPDFDIPGYAVRNLGYVAIEESAGWIRVRLRPSFVGKATLATLLTYVARCGAARIALSWLDDSWRDEVWGEAPRAVRRIAELVGTGQAKPQRGRFLAVRRGLGPILASPRHPLKPVLSSWLDGTCPADLLGFLGAHGLSARAMLAERDGASGGFVFRYSGTGIQIHGGEWSTRAIGRRLEDQPDPEYGRWIAEGCRAADDSKTARHELVAATMLGPNATRQQWRYERLVLPWRLDGRRFVMSVSINPQAASC